jgi:hypothetical protein
MDRRAARNPVRPRRRLRYRRQDAPPRPWLLVSFLPAAAGFAAFCLADLARARQVRYLPKWGWAIACLIQIPLGGIMYLAAGKVPAERPEPPALP